MSESPRIIAVIPARGGSKRFPKKNLATLHGKPLLSYPIDAAKQVSRIDRVIVSTDSEEIATLARQCGAEIPFMRPDEFATDQSPVIDTVVHAVTELEHQGYRADIVVLLQSVTPLIRPDQIERAIDLIIEKQADSVVAVSEVDTANHPYNIREIGPDGHTAFWQEKLHYELLGKPKPKFYTAANMWLTSRKTLIDEHRLEGKNNYSIIVPRVFALDIDTPEDLMLLETVLTAGTV